MAVLLLEAEETSAELFKQILRRVRAPGLCRTVSDGEQAIRYLTGQGEYANRTRYPLPCLIVMDLLLPRMDGFAFLAWRRGHRRFRQIPVFVLTICDEPQERQRAEALGINAFWMKSGELRALEGMGRRIAVYLRQFCRRVRREVAADA